MKTLMKAKNLVSERSILNFDARAPLNSKCEKDKL